VIRHYSVRLEALDLEQDEVEQSDTCQPSFYLSFDSFGS